MEADPCRLAGMNGHWGAGSDREIAHQHPLRLQPPDKGNRTSRLHVDHVCTLAKLANAHLTISTDLSGLQSFQRKGDALFVILFCKIQVHYFREL